MQYYKVIKNSNQFTKLEISTYETDTKKAPPYYQTINGTPCHFAYCPACSNPIQIYNLYNDPQSKFGKNKPNNNKQKVYARHYRIPLLNFPDFDRDSYNDCPFANPLLFSDQSKRNNNKEAQELIDIITHHTDTLLSFIRTESGINFPEDLFEKILTKFKKSDGVNFRHVNKFTLPFSVMHTIQNQDIKYQYIIDNGENSIAEFIIHNSEFFTVVNGQVRPKNEFIDASIEISFMDHRLSNNNDNPQHVMSLVIEESYMGLTKHICDKGINFDNNKFYSTIDKIIKLQEMSLNVFEDSIIDENKIIEELRSKFNVQHDVNILKSLFFLNDQESFSIFIEELKKNKTREGWYLIDEDIIEAIGEFVCLDYTKSICLLVDMVIKSSQYREAASALASVINRVTKTIELKSIVKLLNHREQISSISSIDRSKIGFNILANCQTPIVKEFIINYSKGDYSDIDSINYLYLANLSNIVDTEPELVNQLILHVKNCNHSLTINKIFQSLQSIEFELSEQYCLILFELIEQNLKHVEDSDKRTVMTYAFTTLGNICNDFVFSFLMKSFDQENLSTYVPYAFKRIHDKS